MYIQTGENKYFVFFHNIQYIFKNLLLEQGNEAFRDTL